MGDERERSGEARSVAELVEGIMGGEAFSRYAGNDRAEQAWYRANGDFEHRHTRGVFLREPARQGDLPTLIVYIDSNAILQDFDTNRDIYAIRLAHYGFDVARVEFRLSRSRGAARYEPPAAHRQVAPPLPPLDEREVAYVEGSVAMLDEPLRSKVRDAMTSSLRREKTLDTQKKEN